MKCTQEKFVELVKAYCNWAESKPESQDEEVLKAIPLLAELYAFALALPAGKYEDELTAREVNSEEYEVVFERFGALPFGSYSCFFKPYDVETNLQNEATGIGDLGDDLADVYRDLKNGLYLYEDGHKTEAVRVWKQSFYYHWGEHASEALSVLHVYAEEKRLFPLL